ncbi:MAG TPA: hypothetical protein VHY79_00100, partial [Rhizomicrobium sp.]|nr:hypothetical protein [Rhizomicrobium sp.]
MRQLLSLLETESERSAGLEKDAAEQIFTAADLLSLLQRKMQGNEKQWLAELLFPDAGEKPVQADSNDRKEHTGIPAPTTSAQERNRAEPFSLLQGKTQGSGKNLTEQICPAPRPPAASRARLMTGTAPISSSGR